jgi:hypothetical protein
MKGRMELLNAMNSTALPENRVGCHWYVCKIYLDPLIYFPPLKKEVLTGCYTEQLVDLMKKDLKTVGPQVLEHINKPMISSPEYKISNLSRSEAFPVRTIGRYPNIHYCWTCEVDVSVEQLLTHINPVFREYATRLVQHGLP